MLQSVFFSLFHYWHRIRSKSIPSALGSFIENVTLVVMGKLMLTMSTVFVGKVIWSLTLMILATVPILTHWKCEGGSTDAAKQTLQRAGVVNFSAPNRMAERMRGGGQKNKLSWRLSDLPK